MTYAEAIGWLRAHEIKTEEGRDFEFGDDIPEGPEREMTNKIGQVGFYHRFKRRPSSNFKFDCSQNRL